MTGLYAAEAESDNVVLGDGHSDEGREITHGEDLPNE